MIYRIRILFYISFAIMFSVSCRTTSRETAVKSENPRIPVIIDTDANNELDDQHALAYAFFNSQVFDVLGVTVNATRNGGNINFHLDEAERIMKLCKVSEKIPLHKGADGAYQEIKNKAPESEFDGFEAVNFIIETARAQMNRKLVLIPIGKLTNIALAIQFAPDIKEKVRIVWLGSNYPGPGEYNLENDIPSMNYLLEQEVEFEMVTVRYGEPGGSDAVKVTPEMINTRMAGRGPAVNDTVIGRHGAGFVRFGDYSVNLFEHVELYGTPPSRSLFDVVALAIVKDPAWGEVFEIPAPVMIDEKWVEQPDNERKIKVWEKFDVDAIIDDFFNTMENYQLPG